MALTVWVSATVPMTPQPVMARMGSVSAILVTRDSDVRSVSWPEPFNFHPCFTAVGPPATWPLRASVLRVTF